MLLLAADCLADPPVSDASEASSHEAEVETRSPIELGFIAEAYVFRNDPQRSELALGTSLNTRLSEGLSGLLGGGKLFDSHRISSSPGTRVRVRVASEAFDPMLIVIGPKGLVQQINEDRDPKFGTDAAVEYFPESTDAYEIWVTTATGESGEYSISTEELVVQRSTGELEVGDVVEGWLVPGDKKNRKGLYSDRWEFAVPRFPVGLWATSDNLDVYIKVLSAEGLMIFWANDLNPVGGDRNALIYMDPETLGVGRRLQIEIGSFGPSPIGSYQLEVGRFPESTKTTATLTVRLLRIAGTGGRGGSQSSSEEVIAAFDAAQRVWRQCGIDLMLDDEFLDDHVIVEGLEEILQVKADGWSPTEKALLAHSLRLDPSAGGTTVFVVRAMDTGGGQGLSFPTTRYSPRRTGILLSDTAIQDADATLTFAHEIGHMLGLLHSSASDGDSRNDVQENLMTVFGENQISAAGQLTPFQCALARRSPHLLKYLEGGRPSDLFTARDRLLVPGKSVEGSLTDGDSSLLGGRSLDLYYFEGEAEKRLEIEVSSEALDPVLILETADGERLGLNDDGGSGTTAVLEIVLPSTGDYVIGVTSSQPGSRGSYRLRLTEFE